MAPQSSDIEPVAVEPVAVESVLRELVEKIERLEKELVARVDRLESRLDAISSSATRMDDHISFVESVYERVKSPFHFLMNSVGRIRVPPRLLDTI